MRKHQIQDAAFEVATQVRAVEDSIDAAPCRNGGASGPYHACQFAIAHIGFGTVHPVLEEARGRR